MPRSWLKPTQNLLVLFEELGGDPTRISLMKRSVTSLCADVAEYHPMIKNWHIESYGKSEDFHRPKVHLQCSRGQSISSIKFASFGTPLGTCGSYQQGTCHAPTSYSTLEKVLNCAFMCLNTITFHIPMFFDYIIFPFLCCTSQKCIGQQRCSVIISNTNFGQDPCPNVLKRLTVEAICSPTTSTTTQPNTRG